VRVTVVDGHDFHRICLLQKRFFGLKHTGFLRKKQGRDGEEPCRGGKMRGKRAARSEKQRERTQKLQIFLQDRAKSA